MTGTGPCLITLSWGTSILLACGLLAPLALSALWMAGNRHHRAAASKGLLSNGAIPTLDAAGDDGTPIHTWHPGMKIAILLGCCFILASLHSVACAILGLVCALALVTLSRIPWRRSLRRLAALSGFLGVLLILLPWTGPLKPGDTALVLVSSDLPVLRVQGLRLALAILFKSAAIALLMDPMLATAPLARTMQGCAALGIPPALVQMILLCYRYVFVFVDEGKQIHRAMRLRGFLPRTNITTMRIVGSYVGMLCIRAFERTQRIHEAMLGRGYRGIPPDTGHHPLRTADWWKGALCLVPVLLLLACDQAAHPW